MSNTPRKIDPSIIAALIGVSGTIVVTLITLFANRQNATPTPLPTSPVVVAATDTALPVPTDTVPAGAPTSTPAPTDTPAPEPTATFTVLPPVAIGSDWTEGCVSMLWSPVPAGTFTDKGNGCWQEPLYTFSADGGALNFLSERSNGGTEVYGMFAPLPESGEVSIKIRLNDLSNADMWVGVFQQPDITSQGLLLTIAAGDPKKRVIAWKDIATYETIQKTNPLNQDAGFWFTFNFNTLSVTGTLEPSAFVTDPVSLPSSQKWLFIGYKGLQGFYRVEGAFFDFSLK